MPSPCMRRPERFNNAVTTNSTVLRFQLKPSGPIPNNPTLPLIVYKGVFNGVRESDRADVIERQVSAHGWIPAWRWGVYDFAHYHSTAHELLGVFRGSASLRLGYADGVTLAVEAGDVLVIPAGVAHQNLGSSPDFEVVGAYPEGQTADLIHADQSDRAASERRVAKVPLPKADPLSGPAGALVEHWHLPL